ncbi:ATP synthase subunit C lysine N-methyltransferase-like [Pollicipes pollicipes]|uniref:ATP synthase subunit C lysine N-methyltransferase-like n=1 Tax=Pollicipes pollicipes TaxID=41117 RepID=UPI001884D00C|nr:ATP synthase subunit C lysine N-methyltransferase-like [Pollicipes pollicipes]
MDTDLQGELEAAPPAERPRSKVALVMASITGAAAVGLTVVSWPFVAPAFRKVCLPYVPATTEQVMNVLRVLKGRSGPLVDLGSGDGRIVSLHRSGGEAVTPYALTAWVAAGWVWPCYDGVAAAQETVRYTVMKRRPGRISHLLPHSIALETLSHTQTAEEILADSEGDAHSLGKRVSV